MKNAYICSDCGGFIKAKTMKICGKRKYHVRCNPGKNEIPQNLAFKHKYEEFLKNITRMNITKLKETQYGYTFNISSPLVDGVKTKKVKDVIDRDKEISYDSNIVEVSDYPYFEIIDNTYKKWEDIKQELIDDKEHIWRGMCAEEYEILVKLGVGGSEGTHNIGESQEGLTYFSDEHETAFSYAGSFAPWYFRPTYEKPGYVIKIKKPKRIDEEHAPQGEIGVYEYTFDDVLEVYEIRLVIEKPGNVELLSDFYNKYYEGSRFSQDQYYVYKKIHSKEENMSYYEPREINPKKENMKTILMKKSLKYDDVENFIKGEIRPKALSNEESYKYLYRIQNIRTIPILMRAKILSGNTPREASELILEAHPEYRKEWEESGVFEQEETWGIDEQMTTEPRLYFVKKEKTGYVGDLLLRVERDIADEYGGELFEDCGLPGEYFYDGRVDIPIEYLEFKMEKKWFPLIEYNNIESKLIDIWKEAHRMKIMKIIRNTIYEFRRRYDKKCVRCLDVSIELGKSLSERLPKENKVFTIHAYLGIERAIIYEHSWNEVQITHDEDLIIDISGKAQGLVPRYAFTSRKEYLDIIENRMKEWAKEIRNIKHDDKLIFERFEKFIHVNNSVYYICSKCNSPIKDKNMKVKRKKHYHVSCG